MHNPSLGFAINEAPKRKYVYLDLARGLAALAVCSSHLRAFVFVDFNEISHSNIFWKLFYFLTGFGHQAVMVFFVLSGFLISKNIYFAFKGGRWSWTDYAIKRLSRLWMVLIPALVLTAIWDQIGIHVYHGDLYFGLLREAYHSTPAPRDVGEIYRLHTFLGNAVFLQTIVVPPFGTNGPLWSLANEFWYYVIFPLGFLACCNIGVTRRIVCGVLATTICLALPGQIVLYGVVWLLGFFVVLFQDHIDLNLSPLILRMCTVGSLLLFVVATASGRFGGSVVSDFACGVSFAPLLYFLTKMHVRSGIVSGGSKILSEFSYSLYLAHFPLLALLSCIILKGQRLQPGVAMLALYLGLLLVVTLYSYLIYLLFERNTGVVQTFLTRRSRVIGLNQASS
jgi:peptidoglycan/LPS O-acetylase OafA/YrhL